MAQKVKVSFGIVPLMLGFGLLLTGGLLLLLAFRPDLDAETTAEVSDIQHSMSGPSNAGRCSLEAEFIVDGKTYVAGSLDASPSNCDVSRGDEVVVQYKSSNPRVSQIRLGYMPWLGGGLTAGGLVLLIVGIVLLARKRRRR